jgi:hypothetical protein
VFAEPIRQASPGFVRYFFNDDCLAVLEPVGDDDPVATAEVNGIAALLQFQMVVSGYLVDA